MKWAGVGLALALGACSGSSMAIPDDVQRFAIECEGVSPTVYRVDLQARQWCVALPGADHCQFDPMPIVSEGEGSAEGLVVLSDNWTPTDPNSQRLVVNRETGHLQTHLFGMELVAFSTVQCRVIEPLPVTAYPTAETAS